MTSSKSLAGVLAASLLVAGAARVARAQDEGNAADVAAARALGVEGIKFADAGDCKEAIDRLQRAEKLRHAITTLARLGECQVAVGKFVEGTENLQRAIREPLAPNAPEAFVKAQERARAVLADARPKIGRLKIAVAAPPDAQLSVKIDGENVPPANLNTNRMVDPGEHVVEASAPGFLKATAKVKLAEGGADSVALTLEADPNASKAEPAKPSPLASSATAAAPASSEPPPPPRKDRTAIYVAAGIGAVGVAAGGAFGIAALSMKGDLSSACPNQTCSSANASKLDSVKAVGTVSTVAFIVGGVGLATALTLYLVDSGPQSTRVGAYVGPGSAGVAGRF